MENFYRKETRKMRRSPTTFDQRYETHSANAYREAFASTAIKIHGLTAAMTVSNANSQIEKKILKKVEKTRWKLIN